MPPPFEVPKGDPGKLRREAAHLRQAASDLHKASKAVEASAVTALFGWTGPRSAMYATSVGGTFSALDLTGKMVDAAGQAIRNYAAVLEKIQREIRDYHNKYLEYEKELARPDLDEKSREYMKGQVITGLPMRVTGAENELKKAGNKAEDILMRFAELKVGEAKADPSPKSLYERIRDHPVTSVYSDFKGMSDPALAIYSLMDGGNQAKIIFKYLRNGTLARQAQRKLSSLEARKALITRLYLQGGGANAPSRTQLQLWSSQTAQRIEEATGRLARAEEAMARARPQIGAALGESLGSVKVAARVAKGAAVLGIVSGAYDVFYPPEHHGKYRQATDRFMGGLGVYAGLVVLFGSGAGEAILISAIVAGTVSAGWTLGNDMVDNPKRYKGIGGWLKRNTVDKVSDGMKKFVWSTSRVGK